MKEINDDYDVIVAGAGPAGCLIARDLAKDHKISVLLLDLKGEDQIGHDWWDSVEVKVFSEVGLAEPSGLENLPQGKTRFYSPSGRTSVIFPPSHSFSIDRKLFGRRLLTLAKTMGVEFLPETEAISVILDSMRVIGVRFEQQCTTREITSKLVIDATGFVGALRRSFPENKWFPQSIQKTDTFITYRDIREIANTNDSKIRDVWFGRYRGVQWVARDKPGFIDFFAGVIALQDHPSPKELVRELIDATPTVGERKRAGYESTIPVRRDFYNPLADGLLLVGDAAAQCNPIDGSGIASSMLAASQAAKIARTALSKSQTSIPDLWGYNYLYKTTKGRQFAALDILQKFLVFGIKEDDLDYLFRRRIISFGDFWGAREKSHKYGILRAISQMIRGIDRLGLLRKLKVITKLVEEIDAHYLKLPNQFDETNVAKWCRRVEAIYRKIPVIDELPWSDYSH